MSSEKTTNLNLHKWIGTDYVKRLEFNENFETIDQTVTGHLADETAHVVTLPDNTQNSVQPTGYGELLSKLNIKGYSFSSAGGYPTPGGFIFSVLRSTSRAFQLLISSDSDAKNTVLIRTANQDLQWKKWAKLLDDSEMRINNGNLEINVSGTWINVQSAVNIAYANAVSGLTATNIQSAIDEIVGGKVISESGENANGRYTKFANGTMICTRSASINLNTLTAQDFPFPATFTSVPFVSSSAAVNLSATNADCFQAITNIGYTTMWRLLGTKTGGAGAIDTMLYAVGEWK